MILVLGGTVDAVPICNRLIGRGHSVLLSNLTRGLNISKLNPSVVVRTGPLDETTLESIIERQQIDLIVDATHPYAEQIKQIALSVSSNCRVSIIRFDRMGSSFEGYEIIFAKNHSDAAAKSFELGDHLFLSIGSRNLFEYSAKGGKLTARILNSEKSIKDAFGAGLRPEDILPLKGPFSVAMNIEQIKNCGANVLVTKDSGDKGNVAEKLDAAKELGIPTVVIARPAPLDFNTVVYNYDDLMREVQRWKK